MSFAKLDSNFAGSSLLAQGGLELAGFWAVLLSKKDSRGEVHDSLPKLAHDCYSTKERIRELLELLAAPDQDSRTPAHEGRRIRIETEPRWRIAILNHERYRDDPTNADRQRRWRERQKVERNGITPLRNPASDSLSVSVSDSGETEGGLGGGDPRAIEDQVRGSNFRSAAELDIKILHACRVIAEKAGIPAWQACRKVTSYRRRDGTVSAGVEDPSRLQSILAREKAFEDAEAWIAFLETGGDAA